MKGLLVIVVIVAAFGLVYALLLAGGEAPAVADETAVVNTNGAATPLTIFREVRSEGWTSSTPINNALLDQVPEQARVTFIFALDPSSTMTLTRNGEPVEVATQFTQDSSTMLLDLTEGQGSGPYLVEYRACIATGICTSGRFGFTVR
ncbi:MAG: copper resistance protein CopC [Candidatus Kerfeldbacteria bacterium]|nr:copper resistance protein CopC [Candidatus Kerfeldbacteria bacterium]